MGAASVDDPSLRAEEELYIRIHKQWITEDGFAGGFRPVNGGISADRASMCGGPGVTRARISPRAKSRPQDYGVVTVKVAYVDAIPGLKAVYMPVPGNPAHVDIRDDLSDEEYLNMVRVKLEAGVVRWEFRPGDP